MDRNARRYSQKSTFLVENSPIELNIFVRSDVFLKKILIYALHYPLLT